MRTPEEQPEQPRSRRFWCAIAGALVLLAGGLTALALDRLAGVVTPALLRLRADGGPYG